MGTQNYRDGIGKNRSEVSGLDNTTASRIAQRKAIKEKPVKTKSFLLSSLFFLFILIPVSILIYVYFFYEPNDTLTTSQPSNEVNMESTIPDAPLVPVIAEDEESEAEAAAAKEAAEKEEAEKQAVADAEKQEADQAAADKEKAETEAAQAEADKQKEQAEAEQSKQETTPAPVAASKTHTVQPGETLYRIAVNTYGGAGATEGVEKIKAANGLNSNEITAGATLILP